MNLIIKNASVFDSQSEYNNQQVSIYISNGIIEKISKKFTAQKGYAIIESPDLGVSTGWTDIFSNFNEPGNEQNETLKTGVDTAKAGGFTRVYIVPNTNPTVSNKSQIESILSQTSKSIVDIKPIGAVTKNIEGKELSEMYDMHSVGTTVFSDGTRPIQSAGLLLKALQYTNAINGTIIQIPDDSSISKNGLVNESENSVKLGFAGKPPIAEHILLERDIAIANYTEANIHFTGISTAKSVEIIKQAKKANKKITCSVTPYHLLYNEESLKTYNSNFKVNPPLRTEADRVALINAVKDGTIDCIASHHSPHCWDEKNVEFEYAKYGMNTLQTVFSMLNAIKPSITIKQIIKLFTNANTIFERASKIEVGQQANLTLFDTSLTWQYNKKSNKSKSENSPLLGTTLTGRVVGVVNNKQVYINEI